MSNEEEFKLLMGMEKLEQKYGLDIPIAAMNGLRESIKEE